MVLDGYNSKSLPVISDVPEGSALCPVLFLISINDLPKSVNCSVRTFAGDTLLYRTISKHDTIKIAKQPRLMWCLGTKMGHGLQYKQSKIIGFSSWHSNIMTGVTLEQLCHTCCLGVIVQADIRFESHIQNKISVAKRQIRIIKWALYWAPEKARGIAYNSLCLPHLEYASLGWNAITVKYVNNLEMVQMHAIRFTVNIKGRQGAGDAKQNFGLTAQSWI